MLHVAPQRVESGSEQRMSAIEQLDELIESVRKNVEKLQVARDQAATLAETMGKRLESSTALLQALARVREQVGEHGGMALETVAAQLDHLRDLFVEKSASAPLPVGDTQVAPSPSDVAESARELLLEVKRPMKRGQLVRALEAKGMTLVGKDKNKNLGTIVWRNPRMFVNVEGLGYWVKGVPLVGIYDPERDDEPLPKTTLVKAHR